MKNLIDWVNEAKMSGIEQANRNEADDPKTRKAVGNDNPDDVYDALMAVWKRGYGAAKTNWGAVRPHIKALGKEGGANAWGHARVNAFKAKGKTYQTADSDWADWLKGKGEKPKS